MQAGSPLSRVVVDGDAVAHNVRAIRAAIGPRSTLCAVVKSDAYGLGAARLGPWLERHGATSLAVYRPDEAECLLEHGVKGSIVILMPPVVNGGPLVRAAMAAGRVELVIHAIEDIDRLEELVRRLERPVAAHLKIDTGMHRGGCRIEDLPAMLDRLAACEAVRLVGIMSHLAESEAGPESAAGGDFTSLQKIRFDRACAQVEARLGFMPKRHIANTCAVLRDASLACDMVRAGLGWAGFGPGAMRIAPRAIELRPAVSWRSVIVHVRRIEGGERAGYGRRWTAPRATRLGVVPVGYADGYPCALGGMDGAAPAGMMRIEAGGAVHDVPVAGAVSMDQVLVDLGDLPVRVGDPIEVIGSGEDAPNRLETLAARAGIAPHALLAGIGARVPRVHERFGQAAAVIETIAAPARAQVR